MIQHNIQQLMSIYYNVRGLYALTRKEPTVTNVYKMMSNVQFQKVPTYMKQRMNLIYQEAENQLFSYQDYAFVILYYFLINEKLPIVECTDPINIRNLLDQFYDQTRLNKDDQIIKLLTEKEERLGKNIFEPDILGKCTFLDMFKENLIVFPSVMIHYEKMENKLKSFNKQNKTILRTTKLCKELLKQN